MAHAQDTVVYPGPTISPTKTTASDGQWVIGNEAIAATFLRDSGSLRLASLRSDSNGFDLKWSDSALFSIVLVGNAKPLTSGTMKLAGDPHVVALTGNPGAVRLSDRLNGQSLRATFSDESSGLSVEWAAIMRDGANYLRQELTLRAGRGPMAIERIEMVHASIAGAGTTGPYDGMPIVTDKLFLGIEHPMARSRISAASEVQCWLPRRCELKPGSAWTVSSGIGVYPPGQLRRAFLHYLERERAHPYRQYWHYNSWYDLNIGRNDNPDPLRRMTEAQCLGVIGEFGRELHDRRGVGLDGFVWDDGWDDWNTLWQFHAGFPHGFTKLKESAAQQGAGMGAWLSPWGGYGGSHQMRVKFGRQHGYETNAQGFSLAGDKYYAAFRDTCLKMIRDCNQNYFKFDGIGGGTWATGAPESIAADLDGLVCVLGELRLANPDVFINCTVGTWPSPYWTFFADSIWRGGEDFSRAGDGNAREQWITYRDGVIFGRFARPSRLYPLNSLMYHGLLVTPHAGPAIMPAPAQNIDSYRHEVLMSVACGSGLGELYVTPSLMTPEAWDILAAGLKWSRSHRDILCDAHWVGGKPGSEVYGYAAWHPTKGGTVVLRNATSKPQTFVFQVEQVFELPVAASHRYALKTALGSKGPELHVAVGKPATLTFAPFEVRVYEAAAE
jgi:hypothetical protein